MRCREKTILKLTKNASHKKNIENVTNCHKSYLNMVFKLAVTSWMDRLQPAVTIR